MRDLSEEEIKDRVRRGLQRMIDNDYSADSIPDKLMLAVFPPPEIRSVPVPKPLSERERQVIVAASCGLTNDEIAVALSLSTNTIMRHLQRINDKLAAKNRTHAVAIALRKKMIY